ncbi:putative membrane protein [Conyzicola lurida]|uniref:Putative membrane protein n=1 Tax=Conyzicola lurida TaxID=1172621 RepID=A0A841ASC7_9MICO|nr:putative membrane protein [Conyzicola lurida]
MPTLTDIRQRVRLERGAEALRAQPPAAWVVAAVTTALYSVLSYSQWITLKSPSWDLGIFTELAKAYSRFEAPIVPIKGDGFNLLGDHFHPLLVLLGPVFAVFPSAFTLLIVQNVLIGVSAFVVTRAATRALGRGPGALIGTSYALSWGLQAAVDVQFHEIAFALPLLALSLEAILEQRWRAAALWAAPLVFVKEDLGLTVAFIGGYLVWKAGAKLGFALVGWGVGWLILALVVILPLLNTGGHYAYGLSTTEEFKPLGQAILDFVLPSKRYETVGLLLLACAGLALRSPLVLIMVPTLAWRFVSTNEGYWGPGWHYSAVLMPVLYLALVDAVRSGRVSRLPWMRSYAQAVPAVVVTVAIMLLPSQALGALVKPETFTPPARAEQAYEAMDVIPDGATVEADIALMHYLVPDTTVFWLGNPGNPGAEYIIMDRTNGTWGGNAPADAAVYAEQLHPGTNYTLVYSDSDYQVAERQ